MVLINHRFIRGSHFLVEYIHLQVYACKASAVERYLASKSFRTCLIFTKHSLVQGQDPTGSIAQKYYVQRGAYLHSNPSFFPPRNWLNPRIGQAYSGRWWRNVVGQRGLSIVKLMISAVVSPWNQWPRVPEHSEHSSRKISVVVLSRDVWAPPGIHSKTRYAWLNNSSTQIWHTTEIWGWHWWGVQLWSHPTTTSVMNLMMTVKITRTSTSSVSGKYKYNDCLLVFRVHLSTRKTR